MEDLPYDLSMALKESSQAVEQTVRRHNRKRRGKKRRSNPNIDFDLNEVDFPNRSDASSGGGGGRHELSSIAVERSTTATALAVPPSAATVTAELAAATVASAEPLLPDGGAIGLLPATADLSRTRPAGRASAARSDSDDVHIVTRLSALTLPPSAAQLPVRLAAAAGGATTTAKMLASGTAAGVTTSAARSAAASVMSGGTTSCGHSLVKDLESDSVNEKSPARPLNQRRRRRLRHMLVDETTGDAPGDGINAAGGGAAPSRTARPPTPAASFLHGRLRPSDFASLTSIGVPAPSGIGATPHASGAARQLWKRKRKQKMDTSEEQPAQSIATGNAAALLTDRHAGAAAAAFAAEDDRMQAELLSSELSSTSSEDESTAGRWRHERGGGAAYDDAQEGDDEQSDFFHEPGPSYGVPPVAMASSWWGKENERGSTSRSCDATSGSNNVASVTVDDGFRGCSYFGYRTQSQDSGFLVPPVGDDRFSSHRHLGKLDRPFRIGRRRLKSASYRPHDESLLYTAVAASPSRGTCPLIVPSPLAQQLSQSTDIKRRRKAMLPVAFDEPGGSSSAVSRSVLIPHSSSTSAFSAGSSRANEGLAHASL